MKLSPKVALAGFLFAGPLFANAALADPAPASENESDKFANSGPVTSKFPLPDPSHITLRWGKDIQWKGKGGGETPLFGDPDKPGIYGFLVRWNPGTITKPHFHSTDRYIYVVSGTWWVGYTTKYDKDHMYPIPPGTFVTDIKGQIHWDGAKAETGPCILMIVGEGPMVTTRYVPADPSKPAENQEFVPDKNPPAPPKE